MKKIRLPILCASMCIVGWMLASFVTNVDGAMGHHTNKETLESKQVKEMPAFSKITRGKL